MPVVLPAFSIPNPLVAGAYLSRGLWLWIAARVLGAFALAFAELDPIRVGIDGAILIVVATVALSAFDIRIRKEAALLGNLGLSTVVVVSITAIPAIVGEVLVALAGLS